MLEANCDAKVIKVIPKIIEKCKDNFNKKKKNNILPVSHVT